MTQEATPKAEMIELRHVLHQRPELAGHEGGTAELISTHLMRCDPRELVTDVGGHGVIALFEGARPGPTVLFRCELDALPIDEPGELGHRSQVAGVSHTCGHDGHMAILMGLATRLGRQRPARGRVALLFQPAEETGEGAERVLGDPKFAAIAPDLVLALHNIPGYPLGQVVLRNGSFASASEGLIARFDGATSHAGEPERGRSPALAVAQAISALIALPQLRTAFHHAALITVVGARFGGRAFGTSPGEAELDLTLRSHRDREIVLLRREAQRQLEGIASAQGLELSLERVEPFPATVNAEDAVDMIEAAARRLGREVHRMGHPFPWSEDFGHFTSRTRGALFGIGAGVDQPALHHPSYDFPDALVEESADLLAEIAVTALSAAPAKEHDDA